MDTETVLMDLRRMACEIIAAGSGGKAEALADKFIALDDYLTDHNAIPSDWEDR
jgi:hypothetical protein